MRLKKTIFLIICLVTILSIPTFAEARNAWDEKMDIGLETFKEWMETFKSEETPIEKRIIDYEISQSGGGETNNIEDKIDMTVHFRVTPVDEENTYWQKDYANICFIKMSKVDGEFKVDYISDKPENYDKFLEKFEEYKKNNPTSLKTEEVQGEMETKSSEQPYEIKQISNIIIIICIIILLIVVICVAMKLRKKQK